MVNKKGNNRRICLSSLYDPILLTCHDTSPALFVLKNQFLKINKVREEVDKKKLCIDLMLNEPYIQHILMNMNNELSMDECKSAA